MMGKNPQAHEICKYPWNFMVEPFINPDDWVRNLDIFKEKALDLFG